MTDLTTLRDLYARLEKATGPDRELDWAVYRKLNPWTAKITRMVWTLDGDDDFRYWTEDGPDRGYDGEHVPRWTESLDAVKALHDRLLPGWEWDLEMNQGKFYSVIIPQNLDDDLIAKDAPTPALAWLKAIVEAKIKEAENAENS